MIWQYRIWPEKIATLSRQTINWKWYLAHRNVLLLMTLSDFQGHSATASLFEWDFCVVVQLI